VTAQFRAVRRSVGVITAACRSVSSDGEITRDQAEGSADPDPISTAAMVVPTSTAVVLTVLVLIALFYNFRGGADTLISH
jgi:hypothetical protein